MNDLATFHKLTKLVDKQEAERKQLSKDLRANYDILVYLCPHYEAVERKTNLRGMGNQRRCVICGVTDYASEGGTPGDEYDYGYPGHPSRTFWANSEVTMVGDKEWNETDRHHNYVVSGGKIKDGCA